MGQFRKFVIKTFLTGSSRWRGKGTAPQIWPCKADRNPKRLVENPFTTSLQSLIRGYAQITSPVTLVCAGNRRKEQNQVRKSKGFSWGAAGLSTALFTGMAMADVIRKARPKKKARFVCMEGADELVREDSCDITSWHNVWLTPHFC